MHTYTTQYRVARIAIATSFILLIPFLAMQFTGQVNWDAADFAVIAALLLGTGLVYELGVRKLRNPTDQALVAVLLVLVMLLIWADLAVGIFNIPGISGS